MTTRDKIDLFKLHRTEYAATARPRVVDVGPARYLAVDGRGEPGGGDFQEAVGALYASAYTQKFASKAAGRDYVVGKLEATYCSDDGEDAAALEATPRSEWSWTLMIRTPDFVRERDLAGARKSLAAKGTTPGCDRVRIETLREGRCVQVLHVGPYEGLSAASATLRAYAREEGLTPRGRPHDVYLSDPRRVEPARLKTILRVPVA